jgi:hypothetical protein
MNRAQQFDDAAAARSSRVSEQAAGDDQAVDELAPVVAVAGPSLTSAIAGSGAPAGVAASPEPGLWPTTP